MEWIIVNADTVDDARRQAIERLGVLPDEVETEVLDQPRRVGRFLRRDVSARVRARIRPLEGELPWQRTSSRRRSNDRNKRGNRSRRGRSGGRSDRRNAGGNNTSRGNKNRGGDRNRSGKQPASKQPDSSSSTSSSSAPSKTSGSQGAASNSPPTEGTTRTRRLT